ncbi:hypothetical protein J7T55_002684 [Diaporthe amygdali]|uniref:uncharacterized protein n=1 Tax=Phomopsis amygdali TaxID=1214568 RepID=UPI0022FDE9D0|nr:uncharacterized protein J7T55_002684 [Diaporthe amygdali]KAJ0122172.1 hypothetical protein J7T55_002684 [Diaporthe amygdali]
MDSQSLRPTSYVRPHSAHLLSPSSDIVGPSPVTSNGTETTEIDDEALSETSDQPSAPEPESPPQLKMLRTNLPDAMRTTSSEEAISVIHAPESFHQWASSDPNKSAEKPVDIISPPESEPSTKDNALNHPTPPPISTNVKPSRYSLDNATPQAQKLHDVFGDASRLRSSMIPEIHEGETDAGPDSATSEHFVTPAVIEEEPEIRALRDALEECWTLCNTLANLSSIHRERVFNSSGTPDAHEKAWKSCWKLCQKLYNSRDEPVEMLNGRANLDLCRDFCQSLFDVRQRKDEIGDSVLRVSFELNNHAQDSRNLPEAFRERTLDFYITLCHRLMKQRSELAEETDSLLRACWSLAEMLFSLRQNSRDGKAPDEELLGSAVQACWELCDIFREGWTQVRPDRGTPRPSQINFFQQGLASDVRSTTSRSSIHSKRESLKSMADDQPSRRSKQPPPVPETPVTEFEDTGDTPISPGSESPQMPNILVLGTNQDSGSQGGSRGGRWSSSASNLSSYSQSSAKTSSTATTATAAEDINVTRIKMLILKAAMNIGFSRDSSGNAAGDGGKGGGGAGAAGASLQAFVQKLPTGSFGSLPAHATLLQNYKNLVLADTTFRTAASLPGRGKRVSAADVAKSVGWMTLRSGQYAFLRDLFRLVYGFPIEEAENRKNVSIAV